MNRPLNVTATPPALHIRLPYRDTVAAISALKAYGDAKRALVADLKSAKPPGHAALLLRLESLGSCFGGFLSVSQVHQLVACAIVVGECLAEAHPDAIGEVLDQFCWPDIFRAEAAAGLSLAMIERGM